MKFAAGPRRHVACDAPDSRSGIVQIGVVMVSCSCFAPTPSMAAMLVNKFRMRHDVLTYNMSGMGCSSSLVCVDMASHLLKALPNTLALIVNHENITENWYTGNDRSMLVCNCLFRLGGAAALVSNRCAHLSARLATLAPAQALPKE